MASKFGTWRQKIKQHWVAIAVIAIGAVVVIALIVLAYKFDWAGFNSHTGPKLDQNQQYRPEKTLWDWLQLLIVPLVLAVGGFGFSQMQKTTEQRSTTDNQREAALQAYIDKISELLLKEHLDERTADGKLKPEYDQVRKIARVRTITILFQLDSRRIGSVFTFLREAGLMSTTLNDNVVSLNEADLRTVNWSRADLHEADLRGANLGGANLRGANLHGADLSGADLILADLYRAHLGEANLSKADLRQANLLRANLHKVNLSGDDLSNANLRGAILFKADLSGAYLWRANLRKATLLDADLRKATLLDADLRKADLRKADLSNANLGGANLRKADLFKANLGGADLSKADLSRAILFKADLSDVIGITIEELEKQTKSLEGAIMPDGSTHS